jgi:hypothetical protein
LSEDMAINPLTCFCNMPTINPLTVYGNSR